MELHHVAADKIVALFHAETEVSYPAIAQVDAYWEALRGGRPMPNRSDVNPRGIEGALEYAFILEQVAPGVGRMRVAGMHLNELLGMEIRGMPLSAFVRPDHRDRLAEVLKAVVAAPLVAEVDLAGERGIGRPSLSARLYMAPLGSDGRGAPRVLGCLQSTGQIGRAPRRFAIGEVRTRSLAHGQSDKPGQGASVPAPGFAEPVAPFRSDQSTELPSKPPYLRLVKSD